MSKHYPSYRFSKCHKMALVRNAEEDAAIEHWHSEPQEGFISPTHPHFVGVDNIPDELLAPKKEATLSDLDEEPEEVEPHTDEDGNYIPQIEDALQGDEEVIVEKAPKKTPRRGKASYKL